MGSGLADRMRMDGTSKVSVQAAKKAKFHESDDGRIEVELLKGKKGTYIVDRFGKRVRYKTRRHARAALRRINPELIPSDI